MNYRRVSARGDPPPEEAVRHGARVLDDDGLLVHPTSTVYGLGGRPDPAVARDIARLKGRSPDRSLLRLASGRDALERHAPELAWTPTARRLAERFWPGPLTLVLDDGTEQGLAVRVDGDPYVRAVLQTHDGLMTSTSLNAADEVPARTGAEAASVLDGWPRIGRPCLLADVGPLPGSPPSTILDARADPPRLLREGAVPVEEVRELLGVEPER